jgi:hypothetical protein
VRINLVNNSTVVLEIGGITFTLIHKFKDSGGPFITKDCGVGPVEVINGVKRFEITARKSFNRFSGHARLARGSIT